MVKNVLIRCEDSQYLCDLTFVMASATLAASSFSKAASKATMTSRPSLLPIVRSDRVL